jgi:hypothetical protein
MIALDPRTVQCMPARFNLVPMATLQPASTTPEEVRSPCCLELWVSYAIPVIANILCAFAGFLGSAGMTVEGAKQIG